MKLKLGIQQDQACSIIGETPLKINTKINCLQNLTDALQQQHGLMNFCMLSSLDWLKLP